MATPEEIEKQDEAYEWIVARYPLVINRIYIFLLLGYNYVQIYQAFAAAAESDEQMEKIHLTIYRIKRAIYFN